MRPDLVRMVRWLFRRLNPYSNGIYSMSRWDDKADAFVDTYRLNPYSNGLYSMR